MASMAMLSPSLMSPFRTSSLTRLQSDCISNLSNDIGMFFTTMTSFAKRCPFPHNQHSKYLVTVL